MKILITGATGFIGKKLGLLLTEAGHDLVIITRNKTSVSRLNYKAEVIELDLQTSALTAKDFEGVQAVINLIGESIDGRWTTAKKQNILNSRVISSKNLLENCPASVHTIVTASAQGIYGDTGEKEVSESHTAGTDFLAKVCQQWEAPFNEWAQKNSTRVVVLRFGMVLSRSGGALEKLITLTKNNLGAALGTGQQWISFISLSDLCRVVATAISDNRYSGAFNVVTPNPIRNSEFTQKLCAKLNAHQLPKVPGFVLKLLLGEMAQIVLASNKVKPARLNDLGFEYRHPYLQDILDEELGTGQKK